MSGMSAYCSATWALKRDKLADILDTVGWMGAVNEDGDPLDMSTVLRSWELRFDAYVVGMGTDTLTLAVGRPPRDLRRATAIAAEHYAFCPDNIQQGVGAIREYAEALVGAQLSSFLFRSTGP